VLNLLKLPLLSPVHNLHRSLAINRPHNLQHNPPPIRVLSLLNSHRLSPVGNQARNLHHNQPDNHLANRVINPPLVQVLSLADSHLDSPRPNHLFSLPVCLVLSQLCLLPISLVLSQL
jgi:hypothetical protein